VGTPFEREDVEHAAMEAQIEPAAPRTGKIELSFTEIEAIRGISLAQADLKRRQDAVFEEILDQGAMANPQPPADARITAVDLDAGTATWGVA
jgi:hypothetical protein